MERHDTGILLNPTNIKLQRGYFKEMVRLLGIQVIYRAPRENKRYDGHGELDSFFYEPLRVGCIFDEHPVEKTMRKLGWNAELAEGSSIIHVPYDLFRLQKGALFIVPSALDDAKGRLFRVNEMSTIAVYPASVACQIAPVWESAFEPSQLEHEDNDFNLLRGEGNGEGNGR